MPITIAELKKEIRAVTFEYGDETVNVSYRVGNYTGRTEMALHEAQLNNQPVSGLVKILVDLIVDWDVYEAEGDEAPLEVTVENLSKLPVDFLAVVTTAISGDMRPKDKTGSTSSGGSLQG